MKPEYLRSGASGEDLNDATESAVPTSWSPTDSERETQLSRTQPSVCALKRRQPL